MITRRHISQVLCCAIAVLVSVQTATAQVVTPLSEVAELVASDPAPGELVAWSVAVDGDTIVVGDWMVPGAAYVFVRSNGAWSQQAKLVPIGATHDNGFGRAVAISGDTILVGAQGEDLGGGAFYVFERTGTAWNAGVRRTIPGGINVGCSVAIEGNRMAIGACGGNAVYVFERTPTEWTQTQMLVATGAVGFERLGWSVDLRGDMILAGAPYASAFAPSAGRAVLFTFDGSTWSQSAILEPADPVTDGHFGEAVALDGDYIAIGAPASNAPPIGAAYVFSRVTGAWREEARIPAVTGDFDDRFGSALALRGQRLAVGAHLANGAWVFERNAGVWTRTHDLVPTGLDWGSRFGFSFAFAGRDLVVGAPYGSPAGSAFVFDLGPSATFTYCQAPPNMTGLPGRIGNVGSASLAANEFTLLARDLPPNAFGLFLCGTGRAQIPMATGFLCVSPLAPGIVRLSPIVHADGEGFVTHAMDFVNQPELGEILPGVPWYFQLWYRNTSPGGYDLTDGLCVTFEP